MAIWLAYCRKSRINTRDRKVVESTDRQRDRLRDWAKVRGEAIEFFVEPDGHRSGASTDHRPQYARMLHRLRTAKPGEVRGVVMTRVDRASRSPSDFFQFVDELAKRQLDYVAIDQAFDSTTPHGRLIMGILIIIAAWEREITSDRMIENTADRQERGVYVGSPVYGYDFGSVAGAGGHKQSRLVPNVEERERLRSIYQYFVDMETLGATKLAMWINGHGWRTKKGAEWTQGSTVPLLRNVMFYRGFVQIKSGGNRRAPTLVTGQHEPIIDEDLAQAVLAKLAHRSRRIGGRDQTTEQPYPLRGLLWCGECGARMVGQPRPHDRRAYRCRKDRSPCKQRINDGGAVERQVWAAIVAIWDWLPKVVSDEALLTLGESSPLVRPRVPQPSDIGLLRAEQERLTKAYVKGRLSEEAYERDYAMLDGKIQLAEASVESIGSDEDPLGVVAAKALLDRFDDALASGSRAALQTVAAQFVERVVVRDGEVIECRFIPALEFLRAMAGGGTNCEPGGYRTHDIHLKRVLLYH